MQGLNEKLTDIRESFAFVVPELILVAAVVLVLMAGLFTKKRDLIFNVLTSLAVIWSMIWMLSGGLQSDNYLFNRLLYRDGFSEFLMALVDLSVLLTCIMSRLDREKKHGSEYYSLLLTAALGGHLLLMSNNLLMVFLSLEIISISSYVLAGYSLDKASSEGSLKFFLFGSVASAIMLYGFSLLYGFAGTLEFTSERFFHALADVDSPLLLAAGLMGISGFLFKMAAVPMQPWAPDVYEAAPMPVIAFLSVAPKLSAVGIFAKFVLAMHLFGQGSSDWQMIVAAVAILTITMGNLSALWQKSPKRMMAYSSIAQSGFLLTGIAAFLPRGLQFMLFYATVYLIMNFCVFVYLLYFEKRGFRSMPSYASSGASHIWATAGLTAALISLAGLPPTAGFTAKLFIFSSLWDAYLETHKTLLIWLLVLGLLNTVISLFFYLRIPYYAFIRSGDPPGTQKKAGFENLFGFILVVLIVVIFFVPGLLMGLINRINFVF